jgi:GNAT superfamily N-acetyltransferase
MTSNQPHDYRRRAALDVDVLQRLFEAAWGAPKPGYDRVLERSFTWISAHRGDELVGFVIVAWDCGVHLFLLDTTVDPAHQRHGIGTRLVTEAIDACRGQGEWMHVDYGPELDGFYRGAGFTPVDCAGVVRLA